MPANGEATATDVQPLRACPTAAPRPRDRSTPHRPARLGEELPIFCERCGYSLNGLPQLRCDACAVLHFSCPECDHHQPINTLRPAVQRVLGRLRAIGLAFVVFLKLNYFGWGLFIWGAAATGIAYGYERRPATGRHEYGPATFDAIVAMIAFMFAFGFAMFGRMLLLRWRRGVLVGAVLAALVVTAQCVGAHLRQWEYNEYDDRMLPSPMHAGFALYLFWIAAGAVAGGAAAWGVWLALANAFLPKRAAVALIEWQRAMSDPAAPPARTDAATSVTA